MRRGNEACSEDKLFTEDFNSSRFGEHALITPLRLLIPIPPRSHQHANELATPGKPRNESKTGTIHISVVLHRYTSAHRCAYHAVLQWHQLISGPRFGPRRSQGSMIQSEGHSVKSPHPISKKVQGHWLNQIIPLKSRVFWPQQFEDVWTLTRKILGAEIHPMLSCQSWETPLQIAGLFLWYSESHTVPGAGWTLGRCPPRTP